MFRIPSDLPMSDGKLGQLTTTLWIQHLWKSLNYVEIILVSKHAELLPSHREGDIHLIYMVVNMGKYYPYR